MKTTVKILTIVMMCLLVGTNVSAQQKGHFVIGAAPSFVFGDASTNNPHKMVYSLEAGISYDVLESLRVGGSFGGFKNAASYNTMEGWKEGRSNGLNVKIGADYLLLDANKVFRPTLSLNLGYRFAIPKTNDNDSNNYLRGAFVNAGVGSDINIGGACFNVSVIGELTQALHAAVGLSIRFLFP